MTQKTRGLLAHENCRFGQDRCPQQLTLACSSATNFLKYVGNLSSNSCLGASCPYTSTRASGTKPWSRLHEVAAIKKHIIKLIVILSNEFFF